ncbi:MAG: YopX family protein [Bacteroidales bacterium]|nr:YopX family protein [Bacteroidales bacterium]
MREIKFRGKDLQYGEWIYGLLRNRFYDDSGMVYVETASEEERNRRMDKHLYADAVDPSTVGQYTGLKDRDGREIYEGDIVDFWDYDADPEQGFLCGGRCLVKWDEEITAFVLAHFEKEKGRFAPYGSPLRAMEKDSYVVIGNIFDNAELLKGGSQC